MIACEKTSVQNNVRYQKNIFLILILVLIIFAKVELFASACIAQEPYCSDIQGTFIAVFISKSDFFLFSDGRVTNSITGESKDNWTKVHKLSDQCGMLVAGKYLPKLKPEIIQDGKKTGALYVDDYAKIAKKVIDRQWLIIEKEFDDDTLRKTCRVFFFIAGYDSDLKPRLFYLDSNKGFIIEERKLFQKPTDIEIACIAHNDSYFYDVSELLKEYFTHYLSTCPKETDYCELLKMSFDSTKMDLSRESNSIGGQTFGAHIDRVSGYKKIE